MSLACQHARHTFLSIKDNCKHGQYKLKDKDFYYMVTAQDDNKAQLDLFSAMGHPFQQFAEMMSRSSVTSGCSLVCRRTDFRLPS